MDLREFGASLIYTASSRTAGATRRDNSNSNCICYLKLPYMHIMSFDLI